MTKTAIWIKNLIPISLSGVQVTGGFDVPINSKVNFSGQTQLYILGTYAYYGAIQFVESLVFQI